MAWDTILDRLVKKSSLEDLSMSSELIDIPIVHMLRKRVPDRRHREGRCQRVEAFLTFLRNVQEASADGKEKRVKQRRVENEVSEGAVSPSTRDLGGHDQEFASYSWCVGSHCVFCVGKRYDIIDRCSSSGENRL